MVVGGNSFPANDLVFFMSNLFIRGRNSLNLKISINFWDSHVSSREQNVKVKVPGEHDFIFDKCIPRPVCTSGEIFLKGRKNLGISKMILRKFITLKDILRLSQALKYMLHK